jgi:hypothetical protein
MALKAELQELVDELEFDSPEDKAEFEKHLAKDKLGAALSARVMKNKDYTVKTQAVAQAKKDLEAAQAKFEEEQNYLLSTTATWKADLEKRLNDQIRQTSEANLYGAALKSKVQAMAAEYGVDPDELLKDIQTQRKDEPSKDTPAFDEKQFSEKFVSKAEFDEASNAVFAFAPMIRDFERDYKKTFGKEYDGSVTDLVREVSPEIEKQRARGRNVDLFGLMREKLDFNGQAARNAETAKATAEAERVAWEAAKTKEIETNLRSQLLADNPTALRKPDESEKWRESLDSKSRGNSATNNQLDDFKRRQTLHAKFEENVAKRGAA